MMFKPKDDYIMDVSLNSGNWKLPCTTYWRRRQARYSITWQGAKLQFDTDTSDNLQRFGTKVEVLSSQYISILESKSHADATKHWKTRKVLKDHT